MAALAVPVPIAVTVAYACAFALSYVLNRIFNFRSHAPVGPQLAVYVVVVVVNYLAFILGVSSAAGCAGRRIPPGSDRAGACEAVYMYRRCDGWFSAAEPRCGTSLKIG